MDLAKLREDFPALCEEQPVAYLDNACVTLRPHSVINAISDYYTRHQDVAGVPSIVLEPQYQKQLRIQEIKLGQFFNAPSVNEIVFTRNATHSLNQVAKGLSWEKGILSSLPTENTTRILYRGFSSRKSKVLTIAS